MNPKRISTEKQNKSKMEWIMGIDEYLVNGVECGQEETQRQNVLLVDLNNLCMRHLFAQIPDPTDISFTQYKIGMLYGIRKLMKKFTPDRVIYCKESHDVNWRKSIYPEYKANRRKASAVVDLDRFFEINDRFIGRLERCMKQSQFLTIPHLEADDLIALTVMLRPKWDITLVSTDKDFHQLHSHANFHQYDPIKDDYVQNINPKMALLEKVVRGDKSDNIPSIKKGVGPKAFAKIISQGLNEWLIENGLQSAFDRNQTLISFRCIPEEYKQQVEAALKDFKVHPFDAREFLNFLIEEGIGAFMPHATEFKNVMSRT